MKLHLVPELSRCRINGDNWPVGRDNHEMTFVSCSEEEASDNTLIGGIFNKIDYFVGPATDDDDHLSAYSLVAGCVSIYGNGSYADLDIYKIFLSDNRSKVIGFRER